MFRLLHEKPFLKLLAAVLLLTLLYSFFHESVKPLLNGKLKTQDFFFNIRTNFTKPPAEIDDIVLVSIDGESFDVLNKSWPWSREIFGTMIDKLKKFSASLICLDLTFVGEGPAPEVDRVLSASMKAAGNVIISSHFRKEGDYVLPSKPIRDAALCFGFINKVRDVDYSIRRTWPLIFSVNRNVIDYSFALKAAASYIGVPPENMSYDPYDRSVLLKEKDSGRESKISLDESNIININYVVKPEAFKTVPFWRVYMEKVDPDAFKDKIVLVGVTAEIFHDIYETPLGLMPGVLLSANEILMYVTKSYLNDIDNSINFWVLLFMALIILIITYQYGTFKGFLTALTLLLLAFVANIYLLIQNYNWDFFGVLLVVIISYIIIYTHKNVELLFDNVKLRKEAITDGLTGLYVFRYFELKLNSEFRKAREHKTPLSLVLLDMDHFKNINDTYGHSEGNDVLRELAKILVKSCRKSDTVCRFGGEEFCVILTDTGPESAMKYAEKTRKMIDEHVFRTRKGVLNITASMGISTTEQEGVYDPYDLIKKADVALYKAKREGRNKVILSTDK